AYLSSVISISLVLLLVGVALLLLVNARSISDYFKENMKVSVMLTQTATEAKAHDLEKTLASKPYIKSVEFISKEQGIAEMASVLGEDFLDIFETAPIPISINVALPAEYVSADSLDMVKAAILDMPLVEEVVYERSLIDALNANIRKLSLVLSVFIVLLLFISFVLINNTIRLSVYARRFTIHTMKMVGATRAFIRKPFLIRSVWQGLASAALAGVMLLSILSALNRGFEQMGDIFRPSLVALVLGVLALSGIVICAASTFFVLGKLLSVDKSELYY
ncbi:MAG: permease-like cell division protein FtsX, partial [Bacteroidales bacterium]|nr:permease-like cell division protein FtsX [Bacteroidales bacterium]